jgi:hypothetical protein
MELWNYGIASVRRFCIIFTFTYFHIFTLPRFHIRPRNAGGVVLSVEANPFAGLRDGVCFLQRRRDAEECLAVAVFSDVQGERPGVHAVDAGHAVLLEVFVQALFRAPVAWLSQVADDKT